MFSNHAPAAPTPRAQGNPALLYRFLGIGMVIIAAVLIIARQSGVVGDLTENTPVPAYALSAVSFLMCAAALIVLKPLVPTRHAGQTIAAYWTNPAVAPKALRLWFIVEGAAVMAAVSYFLGGGLIAAALIGLAVAVYWMNGPSVLAGQ